MSLESLVVQALMMGSTISEEDMGGLRGPHARAAVKFWKENWWRMVSRPGHGRYVVQHHWQGLLDTEIDKSDSWLIENTKHSIHEDLRHGVRKGWSGEFEETLFGLAVFINVGDLKKAPRQYVLANIGRAGLQKGYQIAWKLPQPDSWLDVGRRAPLVGPPKSIGATARRYSKIFAIDWGTYHVGVCREHSFEFFYKSSRGGLKGRYLVNLIQTPRGRVWNILRPENQEPIASRTKLDTLLKELRAKRQKFLVWSDGKTAPEVYDVRSGRRLREKIFSVRVVKQDLEKGLVYGEVLVPNERDAQGQVVDAEEIEETAHRYLTESRKLDYRHSRLIRENEAALVESWIAPVSFEWGERTIKEGTWLVTVKLLSEALKKEVATGELKAFSIRGWAKKRR